MRKSQGALLTFCIVHYKRLPCLKRCIDSIKRYTPVDYNIILLRQGYQGEETESYLRLLEKNGNVEVIRTSRNLGCTPGRNLIVPKATTPFIMTLDNDIYVTQGWLNPVLKIFAGEKDVGVVGFPIYRLDGTLAQIGGTHLKIKNGIIKQEPVQMPNHITKDFIEVDGVSSGAMVFKEEVRNDFRFDTRYFIGFGDIDKDLQLLNSRWRKVICLKSKVFHDYAPADFSRYHNFRYNRIEIRRSYAKFRKKWGLRFPLKKHIEYSFLGVIKYPIEIMYRRIVTHYPIIRKATKIIRGNKIGL